MYSSGDGKGSSAQRDAQGYNAYDAFADTIVQDTLAGAGLVVY